MREVVENFVVDWWNKLKEVLDILPFLFLCGGLVEQTEGGFGYPPISCGGLVEQTEGGFGYPPISCGGLVEQTEGGFGYPPISLWWIGGTN